jgi:AmmeMemoRadiSam system protein B
MIGDAPRLRRAVEAFPVDHDGRRFIGLRDPAGYTSSVLLVPRALLEVLSLLDGEHAIVDIQAAIMRHRGELVRREQIEELARMLDEHGFLDSPRFEERRAAVEREFRTAPVRPAAHAGGAYAGEAGELRRMIDAFFEPPAGPGPIAWADITAARQTGGAAMALSDRPPTTGAEHALRLQGLIAPHIDLHRGGAAYAWAYREVAERCDADCFVVFGTCHAGMADPFALTRKDYDTPLGAAPVDRDFVEALSRRAGQDCFASELAHRAEHSIEFQAVLLRYLFAGRREVTIVPVLASFAHEALARGQRPDDDARIPRFLEAITEATAATGRTVAFIAGADLAHVGPRFGDPAPISADELARVDREDRAMLAAVAAGDAEAFFASIAADGDRRRICGFSPIYALLRALPERPGALRHYGQWPDPNAVVTFASVVF